MIRAFLASFLRPHFPAPPATSLLSCPNQALLLPLFPIFSPSKVPRSPAHAVHVSPSATPPAAHCSLPFANLTNNVFAIGNIVPTPLHHDDAVRQLESTSIAHTPSFSSLQVAHAIESNVRVDTSPLLATPVGRPPAERTYARTPAHHFCVCWPMSIPVCVYPTISQPVCDALDAPFAPQRPKF